MALNYHDKNKKTTPNDWNQTESSLRGITDPQSDKWIARQSRSGNLWLDSDEPGKECIMIQSRDGTKFQMANGRLDTSATRGSQQVTMGEHTQYVTGRCDITADGDFSTKVGGTQRTTVGGDTESTIAGKQIIAANEIAVSSETQISTVADSVSMKTKSGMNMVSLGAISIAAEKNTTLSSSGGALGLKGESVSLEGTTELALQAGTQISIKMGSMEISFEGSGVYINSGRANPASKAYEVASAASEKAASSRVS